MRIISTLAITAIVSTGGMARAQDAHVNTPLDATTIARTAGCAAPGDSAASATFSHAQTGPLHVMATSGSDAGLIVVGPDGAVRCDDDSGPNNDALVSYANAQAGQYRAFVTAPQAGQQAQLAFSGQAETFAELATLAQRGIDFAGYPTFGRVRLRQGFTPDPHTLNVVAGGMVSANGLGRRCNGNIGQVADVALSYETNAAGPLVLMALADSDIGLVVRLPDGSWRCDDNSGGGTDPAIVLRAPQTGTYHIFISAVGGNGPVAATLGISGNVGG